MGRAVLLVAAACAVLATAAEAASAGIGVKAPGRVVRMRAPATAASPAVPPSQFKQLYLAPPYRNAKSLQQLRNQSNADVTVPFTTYGVTAGQNGTFYQFSTIGGDVTSSGTGTTSVGLQVFPVIVTFSGTGDVYDPTVTNGSCGETVSPVNGVFTGPLLVSRRWYAGHTFIGYGQYIDSAQRGSFWGNDNPGGTSPNYHVLFSGSYPANGTVTLSGSEVNAGTCNALGEYDFGTMNQIVQNTLNGNQGLFSSNAVPLFLFKNVVFTENNGATCCVLGWHSAFTNSSGNTQTYAVADYITDGEFGGTTDQAPLSHELGEWANDPFVNNATPSWGHTGQVSGCQSNLEVGDPLSGTVFAVPPPTVNSSIPTYHLQELAYWGWFYDFNAGVNGWYSTRGTFTSGAALC